MEYPDELFAAIAECDRECADEIRTWSSRDPDELYFSVSVRDWRVIRAALPVQNSAPVSGETGNLESKTVPVVDSDDPPEPAP